jgi:hypothetical protein
MKTCLLWYVVSVTVNVDSSLCDDEDEDSSWVEEDEEKEDEE